MECSRSEISCLRFGTEDVDSFDKGAELYFEARDNANDEETYDSPWDEDNSSESGEEPNEEEDSCITSLESDLSEKAKVTTFALVRVKNHAAQAFHWINLLRAETTVMN